jgi:hypothetical protein
MNRDFGDERLDTCGDDGSGDYGDEDEDEDDKNMGDVIAVDLDDVEDDEEYAAMGGFTIKESKDGGLADVEQGSEVYLSEMLVRGV